MASISAAGDGRLSPGTVRTIWHERRERVEVGGSPPLDDVAGEEPLAEHCHAEPGLDRRPHVRPTSAPVTVYR